MHMVLLAGNSLANKAWIESVAEALRPTFSDVHVHYYEHWTQESGEINFDVELKALIAMTKPLDSYIIFAKSAGVLLALRALSEAAITPEKCVFVGMPIHWGSERHLPFASWLRSCTIPTLFIQKEHDPAGSYAELSDIAQKASLSEAHLRCIPGDSHHYGELDALTNAVAEFIALKERT